MWPKRTFFFAALEQTDVHDSALQVIAVPSLAARANPLLAPYQALFEAFPAPTGRPLNANESLSYSPLQKIGAVSNRSIRLDQVFNSRLQAFARYSDVPSVSTSLELGTAYSAFLWRTATVGATLTLGKWNQEVRANYTEVLADSEHGPNDTPVVDSISQSLLNSFYGPWGVTSVAMAGVGRTISGEAAAGHEHQVDATYTVSHRFGRHDLRAGFEFAQLESLNPGNSPFVSTSGGYEFLSYASLSVVAPDINALLAGTPLGLTSSTGDYPRIAGRRYSSFFEDTFRINDHFNLLLGGRWDVLPPSVVSSYVGAPASFNSGFWNGAGSLPGTISNFDSYQQSLWLKTYKLVAPRFGFAYHLKSPDMVIRSGAGLFYDTGLGSIIANTNPLAIWQYLPTGPSPAVPSPPDYPFRSPNLPTAFLTLPRVFEWKTSLEKSLHENTLVSLSYFGSDGQKLLRSEASLDPTTAFLETIVFASHGSSNYHALLANVRANITPNVYALASYTWSHSIDNGSSDTAPILINGPSNKGSSSFDVRQVLTASFGYRIPTQFGRILGGWTLSANTLARTGFPFDVTTEDESIGLGFENADRANLVPGQPIWINNTGLPGGRILNPAAFQMPASGATGNLGRNALVGPGFFQLDTSLRRQVRLYRGISAEASVSAFNLLNHPSFADPVNYLGSALFGQSTSMTNLMLGSGSPTTGITPLFQAGGPRTVELSLRFSF